jgi:hypothetical protein
VRWRDGDVKTSVSVGLLAPSAVLVVCGLYCSYRRVLLVRHVLHNVGLTPTIYMNKTGGDGL